SADAPTGARVGGGGGGRRPHVLDGIRSVPNRVARPRRPRDSARGPDRAGTSTGPTLNLFSGLHQIRRLWRDSGAYLAHEEPTMRTFLITRHAPLLAVAAALALPGLAPAVITVGPRSILSSSDYLAGGRGQYVGRWGNYCAMPIGPRYFVAANHVGDSGTLFYNNGTSTVTAYSATFAGAQDDLAIWQLTPSSPSFTLWAPLYTPSNETGKGLTVIGRGTDKGVEVRMPAATGQLRGWQWGTSDGQVTGGTNTVTSIYTL